MHVTILAEAEHQNPFPGGIGSKQIEFLKQQTGITMVIIS